MIYLDHAATSFPKPPGVLAAVESWFRDYGVSADRGHGPQSERVAAKVDDCRRALAERFGCPSDHLLFTGGGTEAMTLALRGTLRPGDRVLTTAIEHNAIARGLVHLRESIGIEFDVVPCDRHGIVDANNIERALADKPYRMLAFNHASNVTGAILDARTLCAIAREHGTLTLVDACQTAGLLPLADLGADLIAASGHKALHGPPGIGLLAVTNKIELEPLRIGGTGSSTALDRLPTQWPTRFESGTPNTPAILGLGAALAWLAQRDVAGDLSAKLAAIDALRHELHGRGARCFGPTEGRRLPILSFVPADLDPAEAGYLLADAGIHVRTGHHCAPWIHDALGTTETGTVRISVGPFNPPDDVLAVAATLGG